jgi:FkbM family methyltransferase
MGNPFIDLLKNLKHSRGKRFFSETGEDILLREVFNDQTGSYLDIGSGHPVIGSNTYYFYKKGWRGICVDPQPNLKIAYKILRPKDIFLADVISNKSKLIYYKFENSLLSTSDKKVANFHNKRGLNFQTIELKSVSIKKLLPRNIDSTENYFISIDVEGAEIDILKDVDFSKQRPKAIIIESWSKPWKIDTDIHKFFKSANYELIAYSGLSALFVPLEMKSKNIKLREQLANI